MGRVDEVFARARRLGAAERKRYLDEVSAADPALFREVESLLAEVDLPSPLDTGVLVHGVRGAVVAEGKALTSAAAESPPERIGPFRILRVLGEGGMGTVYEAEQLEPVRRKVALKVIKHGMDSREIISRFEAERQALAVMSHPNIASVLDVGSTDDGRPWFAMELVQGLPITAYCDEKHLTTRSRLELFLPVCQAVQHAHQKGIIHRDLKPANILVAEQEGRAQPRVIDFGVAKAMATEHPGQSRLTRLGHAIGTPSYMSPEQAEGSRLDVDTRTDVYSLGVVLYELLTGELPFDPEVTPPWEWLRQISSGQLRAPTPSARVSALGSAKAEGVARGQDMTLRALSRELSGDLDWIVLKAMAPEREQRYGTASALAKDLQRFLDDEPVEARPPALGYRLGKFVRRHRAAVVAVAALLIAVAMFTTALAVQSVHLARERNAARAAQASAEREALVSQRVAEFLQGILESADPESATDEATLKAMKGILDRATERIHLELKDQPMVRAHLLDILGVVLIKLGLLDQAEGLLREALAVQRQTAETDPLTPDKSFHLAYSLNALGLALKEKGDLPRARRLLEESLAAYRRDLDPSDVATNLANLGSVVYEMGDLEASRLVLEEALAIRRTTSSHAAYELTLLGLTLTSMGELQQARSILEEALSSWRAQKLDTAVASVLRFLGTLWQELGDSETACVMLEEAVEIELRRRAPHHPFVARSLGMLGNALREMGDQARARPRLEEALAISRESLRPGHPKLAVAMRDLGTLLRDSGDPEAARELLEQALAIQRPVLGSEHYEVAKTLSALGALLRDQGDLPGARPLLEEALAIRTSALRPESLHLAESLEDLANLVRRMGDVDGAGLLMEQAVPIYRDALASRELALGANHPGARKLRETLVDAKCRAGRDRQPDGFL